MMDNASTLLSNGSDPDGHETSPFGTIAEWVAEQAGSSRAERSGADETPFDPSRYWDIYNGTD